MTPGKGRLCLKLCGPWCYRKKGDIQVIFDRESRRVEIHKLIHVREKHLKDSSGETGVDKGLATLLSCSSGREYGEGFSTQVYDEAERINTRNTNRNYFIQKHKELRHEAESLRNDNSLDPGTKKFRTDCLKREMAHIEDHNLGSKRYRKQHACAMEEVRKAVNHAVKDMIRTEKPSILVKEDLTFTHDSKKKYAPVMRLLSQWSKGILDDRIEYKCMEYHVKTVDVNPAYTSRFCPKCGAKTARGGPHNSVMTCPDCGKMNANTAAAQNILSRLHDPDIEKHTPYKKVEKILIERYRKSHSV
jgi:IS605 OrfB family transposase